VEAPNQHAWGLWSLTLGMDWLATLHSPQPCWCSAIDEGRLPLGSQRRTGEWTSHEIQTSPTTRTGEPKANRLHYDQFDFMGNMGHARNTEGAKEAHKDH